MKRIGFAVAALAFATSIGAQPAVSDAPFACIFEGVTAEQRATAGPAASQRLTDAPADGEQRGGAALNNILAALPPCAAARRWTEAQRELAEQYVLTQLAREHMRRHYAAQNVDLTVIDEAMAAIERGAPQASGTDGPPTFDAMVARLREQGVTGQRPDSAEDIVFIYMQFILQTAELRQGFTNAGSRQR